MGILSVLALTSKHIRHVFGQHAKGRRQLRRGFDKRGTSSTRQNPRATAQAATHSTTGSPTSFVAHLCHCQLLALLRGRIQTSRQRREMTEETDKPCCHFKRCLCRVTSQTTITLIFGISHMVSLTVGIPHMSV